MRVLLDTAANAGSSAVTLVIALVVAVFYVAMFWRIFSKAGQPG